VAAVGVWIPYEQSPFSPLVYRRSHSFYASYHNMITPCCSYRYFRTLCLLVALGVAFFGLQQSSHQLNSYSSLPPDLGLGLPVQTQLQLQWKAGRNYSSHPVTAAESRYLDHQKQQLPAKYSDITTAICHRTLHGNLDMQKIFNFVSYYRLLGFDHVFFWYRPNIAQRPQFDELKALPYVTLTEYTGGGEHEGQMVVEEACLSQPKFAANYTWAFPIDLDEYLWYRWSEPIYKFVVHRLADFHYVSIGKSIYTQRHAVALERNDSGFGLDRYAFTAGSYCYNHPKEYYCPTWRGRAKILVQPSLHNVVLIHGYNDLHLHPGGTHLLPIYAHLKEWPTYLASSVNTTVRPDRIPFYVSREDEVDTHSTMESHVQTEDGLVPLWYDDRLRDWFSFVAQGCPQGY
jgi:hypothetical protein